MELKKLQLLKELLNELQDEIKKDQNYRHSSLKFCTYKNSKKDDEPDFFLGCNISALMIRDQKFIDIDNEKEQRCKLILDALKNDKKVEITLHGITKDLIEFNDNTYDKNMEDTINRLFKYIEIK